MEEVEDMITDCLKRSHKMNEWEKDFIENIHEQIGTRELSDAQFETLEKIWEKVT